MMRIVAIIMLTFCIMGCVHTYYNNGKKYYYFESEYSLKDTLIIKNYMVKSSVIDYRGSKRGEYALHSNVNVDSVMSLFYKSLNSNKIPVQNSDNNVNIYYGKFLENRFLKYKFIDTDDIITFANSEKNETVLFPMICIGNDLARAHTLDGSTHHIASLTLMIYVVKNNKIIYTKSLRQSISSESFAEGLGETVEDNMVYLEQHHWDSLVKWTMQEYLDRLR